MQVKGKDVTPFLLGWLHRHSEGATLRANLSLVEANARLGARIAGALTAAGRTWYLKHFHPVGWFNWLKHFVRRTRAEHERDLAMARYHHYEVASAAFQIGIVLASATIITGGGSSGLTRPFSTERSKKAKSR